MPSAVTIETAENGTHALRRITVLLWVSATLLYTLTASGWIQTIDVIQSIAVATQIVDHGGRLWVDNLWSVGFPQSIVGPGWGPVAGVGHHFYVAHSFGEAFVMLPTAVLRHIGLISDGVMQFLDSLVNPLAGGALVAATFRVMHRLSGRLRASVVGAILIGFASMVWPYAHFSFDATPTALFLMLALLGILGLAENPSRRRSLGVGAALAGALFFRIDSAPIVFIDLIWLLWTLRPIPLGDRVKNLACVAGPLVLVVLTTALYNIARFGSIFDDGHRLDTSVRHTFPLLRGVADLLISPGRGILVFTPLLLVAALGVPWLFRRAPGLVVSQAVSILIVLLFDATLTNFPGLIAWGPRFLVPVLPIALLPLIGVLVRWRDVRLITRVISMVLIAASAVIQIVAVCLPTAYLDYFNDSLDHPRRIEAWHGGGQLWQALHQAFVNIRDVTTLMPHVFLINPTIPDFWWISQQSVVATHSVVNYSVAAVLAIALGITVRMLWVELRDQTVAIEASPTPKEVLAPPSA